MLLCARHKKCQTAVNALFHLFVVSETGKLNIRSPDNMGMNAFSAILQLLSILDVDNKDVCHDFANF